jgi:hypothetical protein
MPEPDILRELAAAGAALVSVETARDAAVIRVRRAVESAGQSGIGPGRTLELMSLGNNQHARRTARAIVRQYLERSAFRRLHGSQE